MTTTEIEARQAPALPAPKAGAISEFEWAALMRDVGAAFAYPIDEDYLHALRKGIDPLGTISATDVDRVFSTFMHARPPRRPAPVEVVQVLEDVDRGRRAAQREAMAAREEADGLASGRIRRSGPEHALLWWAVWVTLDPERRAGVVPGWLATFVDVARKHDVRPEHGIPGEPGYSPSRVDEALAVVKRLHGRMPGFEERERAAAGAHLAMLSPGRVMAGARG